MIFEKVNAGKIIYLNWSVSSTFYEDFTSFFISRSVKRQKVTKTSLYVLVALISFFKYFSKRFKKFSWRLWVKKFYKRWDKRCKCRSFLCSNKILWGIQLSITCRSIHVIYLRYNICHKKEIMQQEQLGISMLGLNPEGNHIYPTFEMVIANVNFCHVILVMVQQIKVWINHFQNR